MLIPHSVDEKYWVCQHVQGLKRELHHSACSVCKYCIHFNSLCVKLNEFGFFASLVIVLGNKTKGEGITFPHLNFKCIRSLKQTKQKWPLKFIGEVMYDLNFQSIFWVCYKFFQIRNTMFGYYTHPTAFLLPMSRKNPGITHRNWWAKARIFNPMEQGLTEVLRGARPRAQHWGLKRWIRHQYCIHPGEMRWFRRKSRREMKENFRKWNQKDLVIN